MKHASLREWRKQRGWTQEELESASGVRQGIISKIERGDVIDPAMSTVLKLARALKLQPQQIDFGSQDRVAS